MGLLTTVRFIWSHPLNRQRKLRALRNFLNWQVGARMVPGPIVFEWVNGTRALVRPGETGMTQNIYCGLHEFQDMAYVLHALTSNDLFIDAGANAGSYTLLACGAKGARGYSFEPLPSTYRRLQDNLAINDLAERVTALNIGLSNRDGELAFTTGDDTTNHVVDQANGYDQNTAKIPVRKLDSVLSSESPTMIKIDVEGYEEPLLQGAEATLAKPSLHSILIELNGSGTRYGFDENNIIGRLASYDFFPYAYSPFTRQIKRLPAKNIASDNTLFIRNGEAMQERLHSAPAFRVHSCEL